MHASQIEGISELTICDQLHAQPKVSSFLETPVKMVDTITDMKDNT